MKKDDILTNVKKGMLTIRKKEEDRPYFKWKDAHDKCLLNLFLLALMMKGARLADKTFPKDI